MTKKIYTYAERRGNRLYIREAWRDGDVVVQNARIVDETELELFLPASRGHNTEPDSWSIYGEPLSRIPFSDVASMLQFKKDHEGWQIHGMDDPLSQFIAKEYPGTLIPDLSLVSVLNVDIEVEHDNGFPEPDVAEEIVQSITMKRFGEPSITLGTQPCDEPGYFLCADEAHLLESFLQLYELKIPDVITGWNVETFDVTYLINRIGKILEPQDVKRLSPFAKKNRNCITPELTHLNEPYYKILGVTVVDYLELYKKFSPDKHESYKLDYIANVELGEGKVDYSAYGNSLMRLYRENHGLFVKYNVRDVELVEKLDGKLQFLQNLFAITYMVKGRIEDSQATVKPWDTLIYNMILPMNIQPPPMPTPERRKLVGGYVKEPPPGLQRWVVTLDLASLYPNIARTLNMSPETIMVRGTPIIGEILAGATLPEHGENSIAANGSQYRQDTVGIIPMVMGFLLDQRAVIRAEMKVVAKAGEKAKAAGDMAEYKRCSYEVSRLNATQLAMKILANGGYGAIANRYFRYFDIDIAEGITMTGQAVIQFIATALSAKMDELIGTSGVDYVLASDTDSCMMSIDAFMEGYVQACGMPDVYNDLVDVADQFVKVNLEDAVLTPKFAELAAYLGSKKSTLSMKREAIADRGLFRAKKHYVLQVLDNEGVRYAEPKLKMVGIEMARTTSPKISKEMLTAAVKTILNGTEAELIEQYKGWKKTFMTSEIHEIAFPRGVSEIDKWLEGGRAKKGTPVQAKAAICYNTLLHEKGLKEHDPIRGGQKLKFAYLKHNNPTGYNVVGFIEQLPKEFELDQWVDRALQLEKAVTTPLESFTELVGWNATDVRAKLDFGAFTEEYDSVQTATSRAQPGRARVIEPRTVNATPRGAKAKPKKQEKPTLMF